VLNSSERGRDYGYKNLPNERDINGLKSNMHARAYPAAKTKAVFEVNKPGIYDVKESFGLEYIRLRKHFGISHDCTVL
jgi:hypothetical protein